MVQIKKQIVGMNVKNARTYGKGNTRKKLVVHQTGNTGVGANAKMHTKLQANLNPRQASWHIQSDDKEIIQSFEFDYRCWHASTGKSANGGNMVGIAWEICINRDGNYIKSLEVAVEGIAQVMKSEGIPMSGLVRHYDEDPKKKNCPAQLIASKDGVSWSDFKKMVQARLNDSGAPIQSVKGETNLYKVQTGAFTNKKNAEDLARKLKSDGYATFIIYEGVTPPVTKEKTVEQLYNEVMAGDHGNGEARKKSLGNRYNEVQKYINNKFK